MRNRIRFFAPAATLIATVSTLSSPVGLKQSDQPVPPRLLLQVHVKGDQIYACRSESSQFAWILKAPDARLLDKKDQPIGKHFAGPTWQISDGSQVTAKASMSVASPDAASIPWLLLKVVSHEVNGVLSRATSIQRLNTKGGKAPASGCEADHVNQEVRVPYSADYLFYAPK